MKMKIWIAVLLVFVNATLAMTIYFLIKPEAKDTLLIKVAAIDVPQLPTIEFPTFELPKVEVTEDDVEAVKETMKTKIYERAQLVPDEEISIEDSASDEDDKELFVEEWGLTFHLPDEVKRYNVKLRKDVLTVERHLQPMVYIIRYQEGEKPSLQGEWQQLASYRGSDYYVRKGSNVGDSANSGSEQIESMRTEVYKTVLGSYHFEQE